MKVLVTGGAGFIGSSIADAFVADGHQVRILDDLSTGLRENVPMEAEFVAGDVSNMPTVVSAMAGVELVLHLAASRAVLRSVEDPVSTDRVNTSGTLVVLKAAADAGARRVVCASSSSVYGPDAPMPTPESALTRPASPYAVSKLAGEHYCRVFAELYGLETLALRYFNVFGPRQRPDSAYAAVVPLFIDALRSRQPPVVHGDGEQRRSFTYIDDVVAANVAAAIAPSDACRGQVYNIAGDESHSVLELLDMIGRILGVTPQPRHTGPRLGDIRNSRADVTSARTHLGFQSRVGFEEGLRRTVAWSVRCTPS